MEETKNSYVGAPEAEMKQEYHKKDKEKNKNKDYRPYEVKADEPKKEEKIEEKIEIPEKVEESKVEKVPVEEIKPVKKKKGKVVLVRKATISVQDENGNNITIRGHREGVKIGDIVEY